MCYIKDLLIPLIGKRNATLSGRLDNAKRDKWMSRCPLRSDGPYCTSTEYYRTVFA